MEGNKTDVVPCGKCPKCLKDKINVWAFRLQEEQKDSVSAYMLTFTYDQDHIKRSFNGHETLVKKDLQKFWKRLRKHPDQITSTQKTIRYFATGEYGTISLRPHYHAIVYNISNTIVGHPHALADIWSNGFVHVAPCNPATIRYAIKYIQKGTWQPTQDDDDREPQFQAQSKNLGISYLSEKNVKYHLNGQVPYVRLPGNIIVKLPRYYKDKIFSKYERKQMAQEAKLFHQIDWNEFANTNFDLEVQKIKFERKQFSKTLKYAQNEKI